MCGIVCCDCSLLRLLKISWDWNGKLEFDGGIIMCGMTTDL